MNLNAYDSVNNTINKKTWLDVNKHQIVTREIKYRRYFTLLKRYNPTNLIYDYFIALSDNKDENKKWYFTKRDDFGRIKIKINSIWDDLNLNDVNKNAIINLSKTEEQEDGEIYEIVI